MTGTMASHAGQMLADPAVTADGGWFNEALRRILFLPAQGTTLAADIDHLHYFVILTTMAGATLITILGGLLVFKYRRPSVDGGIQRERPAPKPPLWLEVMVISFLLGLFCLWWMIGFRQYVRIRVPPTDTMDVYVTAKQWMWKFAYPDGHHTIAKLYVPAGRPVKLIMTSRDVIHSFYVREFRVKQDVLPGRYTTLWFTAHTPGTYRILCAEYCGAGHSTMRGEVVVLSPADHTRWLSSGGEGAEPQPGRGWLPGRSGDRKTQAALQAPGLAGPSYVPPATVDEFNPREPLDPVLTGQLVAAEQGCLRCHTLDGTPHIGPTWAGLYRSVVPLAGGGTGGADEAYLTESMMDPLARLHAGYPPVMPTYFGILEPGQTAAIVELIKSLRDAHPPPAPAEPAIPIIPEGPGATGARRPSPAPSRGAETP
jgi:cytochrome c oxidase subunit 2